MDTATTTTPPVAPEGARSYIDVLPVRGGKRIALTWLPHSVEDAHGEGFAILTSARDRTAYAVSAAPETVGLCFLFTKVGGKGTDTKRPAYLVLCDHDGTHGRCECEGHRKSGHCKHADCVETLIANRWL